MGELFALHLARRLNDAPAVRHYASLVDNHPEGQLLCAYRRARRADGLEALARRFHTELGRTHSSFYGENHLNQVAVRIERRTIAVAVFRNGHLEYSDSRQLSSARDKAVGSAVGFLLWLLERFPVPFATLEAIPADVEIQRLAIHGAICGILRERALSICEVPKAELLESCGQPPLKSRSQLRQVATAIWPILSGTHSKLFIQDAAILGLHVQTERQFIIN